MIVCGAFADPWAEKSEADVGVHAPGKEKSDAHRDEGCVDGNTCSPE